jgi:hypothetical protein
MKCYCLILLLAMSAMRAAELLPTIGNSEMAAPEATAGPASIAGEWFDIEGKSWSVSETDGALYIHSEAIPLPRPHIPGFSGRPVSGKLESGHFTCIWHPAQMYGAEIAALVHQVDTRTPGVLIVCASTQYQWPRQGQPKPAPLEQSNRIELTREKDLPPAPPLPEASRLAADLRSADWKTRRAAIRAIGEHQPAGSDKMLLAALADEFYSNKVLAIRGLAKLKDPRPALPALVSCLLSQQQQLARAATAGLTQMGPEIAPDLMPFFDEQPTLDATWMTPLKDDLQPQPDKPHGYNVAFHIHDVFSKWDAAKLTPIVPALVKQSNNARGWFLRRVAPELKPAGPATDIVVAFMKARDPFKVDHQEGDVSSAIYAIGQLADPRAEGILHDWSRMPGAGRHAYEFQQTRLQLEATRKAATAPAKRACEN